MTGSLSYALGTVSVSTGSNIVSGDGVIWSLVRKLDTIFIGTARGYPILDVTDLSHLEILPFNQASVTNVSYVIVYNSPLRNPNGMLSIVANEILKAIESSGYFVIVPDDSDEPDPQDGDELQYARQPATGKEWRKLQGVWVYQGMTGYFHFAETEWSAATTYARNTVVPRAGRLWFSKQAGNLNHQPESSPDWWVQFLKGGDRYDIAVFDSDRPAAGETITKWVAPTTTTFYAGLSESRAKTDAAATAAAVFSLRKNGVQFGTLTFALGSAVGVFASAANASFVSGDVLTVVSPSPRDETLSGLAATIVGYR